MLEISGKHPDLSDEELLQQFLRTGSLDTLGELYSRYMHLVYGVSIKYFENRLKLKAVEQGANVVFLIPYYKHSAFYDMQNVKELKVVSDIQLYLDLYNYPIRGIEQAEHLYEKRLKYLIND